jgi:drug/metabolite transporter (DMT)-like permease
MTILALALVLASALIHATWNLLAKRAGSAGGGAAFVWLANALAVLCYAPPAATIALIQRPHLGLFEAVAVAGSAALQLGYFLLLQRAYRTGDLSLVYPLARGSGPVLATGAAVLLLGERPTVVSLAGALLIAGGVVVLVGDPRRLRQTATAPAAADALLTGAFIAGYTLWDKYAVAVLLIPPLLMHWATLAGMTVLLSPLALRRWKVVRVAWDVHGRAALLVGLLSPLSYILVLTALSFTPVSYVAPAREIGILIGTLMGSRILAEGETKRRLAAAGAMVLGVIALAVG